MPKIGRYLLLVALVGGLASAAGAPLRASYGARVTGDEPHYLLTALSLGTDGNLDVSDEIAERAYAPFHEVNLDPQAEPWPDGRLVSPHDPLLPLLLAAPMAAGGWLAAKMSLALLAAALAAATLLLAVRAGASPRSAPIVVGLFAASAPLAVYGQQVYPEVPAALAVTLGALALFGELDRKKLALVTIAVIALPWLSIKFVPIAAVLAAVAMLRAWREGARGSATVMTVVFGLAGIFFLVAHLEWYGGLTPYASGDHFVDGEFTVVGSDPNYLGRSRRLIGLLIDDTFGLIPWQPAWALAFPAIGAVVRRGPYPLAAPLAAGWLTATFVALTMQGWWFPGRQLVVVLPLLVVMIALWVGDRRAKIAGVAALGLLGVANYVWLIAEAAGGRLTLIVDFFRTTSPVYRLLSWITPHYLDVTLATWLLQALWLVLGGAVAWWGGKERRDGKRVDRFARVD